MKARLHIESSSKLKTYLILVNLGTIIMFTGHAFVTRNSNETTKHSLPGDVEGGAQDYKGQDEKLYSKIFRCAMTCSFVHDVQVHLQLCCFKLYLTALLTIYVNCCGS